MTTGVSTLAYSGWLDNRFGFTQRTRPSSGVYLRFVYFIHTHGSKGLDCIGCQILSKPYNALAKLAHDVDRQSAKL